MRAMAKAETLVRSYAEAGFAKIHLDASMACAGDPDPLPPELIAGRAARLCRAAEAAGARPVYVIGTEVPVPGGAHETIEQLEVTRTEDLARDDRGASGRLRRGRVWTDVWPRVLAVVVQPGVEFGSAQVVDFVPERARALAAGDRADARPRVRGAFDRLPDRGGAARAGRRSISPSSRSGPGLTFALREALFALAAIEAELLPADERSQLRETLEAAMLADPSHWQGHYHGTRGRAALRPRLQPERPLPLLLAGARRSRRRSTGCSPT